MGSIDILLAMLLGYFGIVFLGSKFFRVDRSLWASCTNLILSVIFLAYTWFQGMLQDSLLLIVVFGVLIIGSAIQIIVYKNRVNEKRA